MVTPSAGSVVLVPFPFSDLSEAKLRPAVALADAGRGDWILCQVTSNPYGDPRAVHLTPASFSSGSLRADSYARPGKLFTANQELMVAQVALLSPDYSTCSTRATVSFALRSQGRVAARLLEQRPSELCISSITLAELRYGAEARRSRKLHSLISTFVEPIEVMSFDQSAAGRFGAVAAALARHGESIGAFDTLIAAHALSLRLTFVTNNTRHFTRVPGLSTENWV